MLRLHSHHVRMPQKHQRLFTTARQSRQHIAAARLGLYDRRLQPFFLQYLFYIARCQRLIARWVARIDANQSLQITGDFRAHSFPIDHNRSLISAITSLATDNLTRSLPIIANRSDNLYSLSFSAYFPPLPILP